MDPKPPVLAENGGTPDLVPRSRLEAAEEEWAGMLAVMRDQLAEARGTANRWMRRAVQAGIALEGREPDRPIVVVMRGEVQGWEMAALRSAFGPETAGLRFVLLPESMATLYRDDLEAAARRVAFELRPSRAWEDMDETEQERCERLAGAAISGALAAQQEREQPEAASCPNPCPNG